MEDESGSWSLHGIETNDPACIHSVEELITYVNEIGFLPLFHNEIPGFSVEAHTVATDWWSGNVERDSWEWRELAARSGKVAYGKFFGGKAGFISKEWIPDFVNYRRDGYDFSALWEDEKASYLSKKIMDLYDEDTELYSYEIKQKAGFGKNGLKNFDVVISKLQMQMYLCVRDFRRKKSKVGKEYGWPTTVYVMPELIWGYDYVTSAYSDAPQESHSRIGNHIKNMFPEVEMTQIGRVI
ncbi:MAG TPA: hypothetical protein VJY54_07115 [Lachnospiraceae bacterium]|nr:hypothetical protein [Lachnospiraceae bacterium]